MARRTGQIGRKSRKMVGNRAKRGCDQSPRNEMSEITTKVKRNGTKWTKRNYNEIKTNRTKRKRNNDNENEIKTN